MRCQLFRYFRRFPSKASYLMTSLFDAEIEIPIFLISQIPNRKPVRKKGKLRVLTASIDTSWYCNIFGTDLHVHVPPPAEKSIYYPNTGSRLYRHRSQQCDSNQKKNHEGSEAEKGHHPKLDSISTINIEIALCNFYYFNPF